MCNLSSFRCETCLGFKLCILLAKTKEMVSIITIIPILDNFVAQKSYDHASLQLPGMQGTVEALLYNM